MFVFFFQADRARFKGNRRNSTPPADPEGAGKRGDPPSRARAAEIPHVERKQAAQSEAPND